MKSTMERQHEYWSKFDRGWRESVYRTEREYGRKNMGGKRRRGRRREKERKSVVIVAEQSLVEFEKFLDRVIKASKLEIAGDRIGKAFRNESQRKEAILKEYIDKIHTNWEVWKDSKGKYLISPFIQTTPEIFSLWLSLVFPFSYRRIDVHVVKGGSNVDCNGHIFYQYVQEERDLLKTLCEKYQVEMEEHEAIRMILTNAIKALDPIITQILETNYRLYISKIDFIERPSSLFLKIDFNGRIG